MLVFLSALVSAAAVAAPFFIYASTEKLTVRDIAAAPAAQRDVTVTHDIDVRSVGASGSVGPPADQSFGQISVRDGVCDHVVLVGRCPSAPNDAIISSVTSSLLETKIGGTLQFSGAALPKPVKLHIVGVYQPRDPKDPFWGPDTLSAQFQVDVPQGSRAYDAAFVTPATLAATNSSDVAVASDLILGPRVLSVHDSIAIHDQILSATSELKPHGYRIQTDFTNLSNAVILDTNRIFTSVPLGAGEVVLFGWFTLFLAIRSTALTRRHDVGVLKLRGVRRRGLWTLMTEQSTVPILAGLPFGMAAGFVGARIVAGAVRASENIKLAALFALAAALVAVIGGLAAALVAERSALATPVVELLRSTPPRRRGWRSDIADLVLVVIAIVGVVQIHKSGAAGGPTLAVLAPALSAFAVGLVVARTLVPLSR